MTYQIIATDLVTNKRIKKWRKYLSNEQTQKIKDSAEIGLTRIYFINKKPYRVITDLNNGGLSNE